MGPTLSEFYYFNGEVNHFDPRGSDKGTNHTYIDGYYDLEFSPKRDENLKILEIGILNGGSLYLWSNFFTKSLIYGIDINEINNQFLNPYRVKIYYGDAYVDDDIINLFEDNSLDYIIDDGPHTYESQQLCINKWFSKLKPGGKLIIEDIQSDEFAIKLKFFALQNDDVQKAIIFDLRLNKHRYDDIILEITKKNK